MSCPSRKETKKKTFTEVASNMTVLKYFFKDTSSGTRPVLTSGLR